MQEISQDSGLIVRKLRPAAEALDAFCSRLSVCGMILFMCMVIVTFGDVFLRYVLNSPVVGSIEITEMLMVMVVFTSIAHTQWSGKHITMDLVTSKLSPRYRSDLKVVSHTWTVAVIVLCVYTSASYAVSCTNVTPLLEIPFKPFIGIVVVGFFLLLLTVAWELLLAMDVVWRRSRWELLLSLVLAVVPVVWAVWFSSSRMMGVSPQMLGVAGIGFMLVLFLSGMPIAFALMATGFIFSCALRGPLAALTFYSKAMFSSSAAYTMSPVMFFMLMGYFCFFGNLGSDLFHCARCWLGHLRGGLAQCSVWACAAFGAVVGDSVSGTITMTTIALPEMRKNGYHDRLSLGTLSCSGNIGSLIPPGTNFIIYGVLAEQSVAALFMSGILPGLLLACCFCCIIWFMVKRNPALAPMVDKMPLRDRILSLRAGGPIILMFLLVIGGIYGGIFTPTEGGAIGSIAALCISLCLRRMPVKKFTAALASSAVNIGMCFTVLTGAGVLGYFLTLSRIPQTLAGGIADMGMSGGLTMLCIYVVMFILGMFIPGMPLLLISVPIFVPIAHLFHWDMIWFGTIVVMMLSVGAITPPFGINLFVAKGIADVPLDFVFRAVLPFILAMIVATWLVIFFPQIALLIPHLMQS